MLSYLPCYYYEFILRSDNSHAAPFKMYYVGFRTFKSTPI